MAGNIKKTKDGYNYKYADLAKIHEYLEETDQTYYQYVETDEGGTDYIVTVPIIDGVEKPPRRGCRVMQATLSGKSNPAQEQGSALTYARRYSLLMAFGLATEDDDAAALTQKNKGKAGNQNGKAQSKPTQDVGKKVIGVTKAKALIETIKGKGVRPEFILAQYKKEKLSELTEEMHAAIIKHIDDLKEMQDKEDGKNE